MFVAGDFNFLRNGESPQALGLRVRRAPSDARAHDASFFKATWIKALGSLTRLYQPYGARYNQDTKVLARLGRVYISVPAWQALQL
eukprot:3850823-Alexandrium_andersonii.AAC.1